MLVAKAGNGESNYIPCSNALQVSYFLWKLAQKVVCGTCSR